MTITPQQLTALLPIIIIGLMIVIMMLSIAWKRNHLLHAIQSIIGLILTFTSLWFVSQVGSMDITSLICVDGYAIFFISLILIASLVTCIMAYPWLESCKHNKEEFYLLIMIATLGCILLVKANHLATLFLGIELISLPLFGLINYNLDHKRSLEASIKYTILSASASSFLLFGIALLYANTGNLSFVAIADSFGDEILNKTLLLAGLGMMIVGLGFKLSLAPFHLWTPDVYQGSPAQVSIFLTTASKVAIFGVVMRLFIYVLVGNSEAVRIALCVIAFVSIILGNLMALNQTSIKRILGYSSISHMGYLMVAVIAIQKSDMSIETVGIYLIGYLLSNLSAFGIVSLMSISYCDNDTDSLLSYRGLFWRHPVLSMVMTITMLSMAGIPATLGFIGKFYILAVSVQAHLWWLTTGMLIGSAVSLYYYLRIVINLYLKVQKDINHDNLHNWHYKAGVIVVLVCAILILVFGLYPQPLINIVENAIPLVEM